MKILLDECLPLDLRHSFPSHDAHNVQWAGLKGKQDPTRDLDLAHVSEFASRIRCENI
jgi:predicted nuclease of predicted toxin-antitoxin system